MKDTTEKELEEITTLLVKSIWESFRMPPHSHIAYLVNNPNTKTIINKMIKILDIADIGYSEYDLEESTLTLKNTVTIHFMPMSGLISEMSATKKTEIREKRSAKLHVICIDEQAYSSKQIGRWNV